jgi:hypothetical protein
MLKLEEISDRLELQQLVTDYANAIDKRAWGELDRVFTPDAYIDYRAMGGIDGSYVAIKSWLPGALAPFKGYMHLIGNCSFALDGDLATGRIACFNPMEIPLPEGGTQVLFLGLWYHDRYIRTANGWRIRERREEKSYVFNVPEAMQNAVGD